MEFLLFFVLFLEVCQAHPLNIPTNYRPGAFRDFCSCFVLRWNFTVVVLGATGEIVYGMFGSSLSLND
jgi:hypothetical protein